MQVRMPKSLYFFHVPRTNAPAQKERFANSSIFNKFPVELLPTAPKRSGIRIKQKVVTSSLEGFYQIISRCFAADMKYLNHFHLIHQLQAELVGLGAMQLHCIQTIIFNSLLNEFQFRVHEK